ncbi:MAG: MerR family transcriptional regulator [Magnetospirillum sp.]|nr:MerR family transcriptional regulator [Magnetospirillum sp.]
MAEDGELFGRRSGKSEAAFRTISEVADELDVPQHVLRFWEGKFPQVKPLKRGGGRRYYRPDDVALLKRIRDLLYSEGYTIKGVQKLLKEGAVATAAAREPAPVRDLLPYTADDGDVDVVEEALAEEAEPRFVAAPSPPSPPSPLTTADRAFSPAARRELRRILEDLEDLRTLLQPL